MTAFFAFIVAMFISMVLIPPLMRSAVRYALVDEPGERKVHARPIPRVGGVAMVAGAVAPVLLWVEPTQQVLGLLYGVAVILVFGVWDDRTGLSYRVKFLGQLLAVGVAVFYGDIVIRYVPFHSFDPIPDYLALPLTVFALLGVTNAINLADGLDGLAGGTTLLSIGGIALMAFALDDLALFMLAMAVMGSIVGFLRYNTHPAQVFMGDCGSQFLGFSTGVLVIILTQQVSTVLSPAMPLLLLGLPLIDTFLVMGQRLYEGRSPFRPDQNHVHHKLLGLGFDHYESVVIVYTIQAALVSLAYLLRFHSDLFAFAAFGLALFGLALLFRVANAGGWRARNDFPAQSQTPIALVASRLKRSGVLSTGPLLFSAVTMPLYAAIVIELTPSFPGDAALTAYILCGAAVAAAALLRGRTSYYLVERLLLYVTITTVVYYGTSVSIPTPWSRLETVYFVLLGLALLVSYRFARNRNFTVTPTDFLIIFIALAAPGLSHSLLPGAEVGEVVIKVLVLFYAAELVISHAGRHTWMLRASVVGVLALLVVRVVTVLEA